MDCPTHPLADIFPPMTADEFAAFKADVAVNGVREAVWVWHGQLLDGRHRRRACDELGIACPEREWDGDEPGIAAFIVSLNLHRRHLIESQRAMVAGRVANMRRGEQKSDSNPLICGTGSLFDADEPTASKPPPVSTADAADLLNVGTRSVESARRVLKDGVPDLVKAVDSGAVPVSVAAKIAELTPERQEKVIEKAAASGNLRNGLADAAKDVPRLKNADADWTASEKERRTAVKKGKVVVAHINADARLVEWADEQGLFVRVDRATEWGNPYALGDDGDRPTVIESYRLYLTRKYGLLKRLAELRGKVLGCWCHPERCHADELVKLVEKEQP